MGCDLWFLTGEKGFHFSSPWTFQSFSVPCCFAGNRDTCCTSWGRYSKLLLWRWKTRKKTDTTWHSLTQLDTTTFSVWFEVDVFLVPRVGFSMFLLQYGQSCHRISLECANLVLFGRQRQRRHRRLLLLRHRIDNIWQLLVELWFGANKYKANLIASTCEARFRMHWCVQGDRQIVTPFQFRSWVKVVALVSCRQLKLRPLQRPLFHALETSREKCRAFHVSCEWSMHEIWSLLNRFWSLFSRFGCLQAKAEAPAAEAKGKPIRVTCWSSFQ